MGQRVIRVGELIEYLALTPGLHLQRQVTGPLHAGLFRHQDDLGPVGAHRGAALDAHVLRHDEHHLVTLDRRGHGQSNAGIAGSGLDESIPGLDLTTGLGMLDHGHCRTILDGTGRIIAFQLHQDGVGTLAGQALQAHQRRVADEGFDGGECHEDAYTLSGSLCVPRL